MSADRPSRLQSALRGIAAELEASVATETDLRRLQASAGALADRVAALQAAGRRDGKPALAALRVAVRAMRKGAARVKRPLRRRMAWLQARLLWRRLRMFLLILALLGLSLWAIVWVAQNRHWLLKLVQPAPALPARAVDDGAAPPDPAVGGGP